MADIKTKSLYDKGGTEFYPLTEATAVISNALTSGSTVHKDLGDLHSLILNVQAIATNADAVNGSLSVTIRYTKSSHNAYNDMLLDNPSWSTEVALPDAAQPYGWMEMQFYWTVDNVPTPLSPIYCITSVAAFAETLVMYTSIGNLSDYNGEGALGGPSGYNATSDAGVDDLNYSSIKWKYYFPGIEADTPYGYMAVRHREAGQSFGPWKISKMAQYPITNT